MMANKRKLLRGNYNITNRYKKYPNLQWSKFEGGRIMICTDCIKTLTKAPRIKIKTPPVKLKAKPTKTK